MSYIFLFLPLFLCSLFESVLAGHPIWEYARRTNVNTVETNPVAKRWAGIPVSRAGTHLWPDKTIKYCFDDDDSETKLKQHLHNAMELWYAANLPRDFKMIQVSKSECKKNRANVLLISHNDKGKLATTPGVPPQDPQSGFVGPYCLLSTKPDLGLLDVTANIAHEIGHAWGLLHEHQNYYFWGEGFTGNPWKNIFTFNCENLQDFKEKTKGLSHDQIYGPDGVCMSRVAASKISFSAADILPHAGLQVPQSYAIADDASVDWKSIMLYSSGVGGIRAGREVSQQKDERASVILRASDGSKVTPNLVPSANDIQGLIKMYKTEHTAPQPVLISDPKNPMFSKFKKMVKDCVK